MISYDENFDFFIEERHSERTSIPFQWGTIILTVGFDKIKILKNEFYPLARISSNIFFAFKSFGFLKTQLFKIISASDSLLLFRYI